MESQYDPLHLITSEKETWRVKVQVHRSWIVYSKDGTNQMQFLEMLLIDQQGTKIQATVLKYLLKRYENIVKEGVTYDLYNFGVEKPLGHILTTKHPYKLTFHLNTEMRRSSPFHSPPPQFDFISFDDIKSQSDHDDRILRDVMARVVRIFDVDTVSVDGKLKKKLEIDLQDRCHTTIECTLWEGHYEQLLKFKTDHPSEDIVIVLAYAKVQNRFTGKCLTNSMYASRLFINENIPDVQEFLKRLHSGKNVSDSTNSSVVHSIRSPAFDPSTEDMDVICIAHIPSITNVTKDSYYVVLATVDTVAAEYNWYYRACKKCRKIITGSPGSYSCASCDVKVKVFDIKYKLVVRVIDDTASTCFTLFDKEVIQLLGKTAFEILNALDKNQLNDTIPVEIQGLVGRKFIFRFQITKKHLLHKWKNYTVMKLSEDKTLIKAIEQKKSLSMTCKSILRVTV